jgi:hypothetical protein
LYLNTSFLTYVVYSLTPLIQISVFRFLPVLRFSRRLVFANMTHRVCGGRTTCQLLNVQGADGVRQTEVQTVEPFVSEPSASEVEVVIGKLKSC